MFKILENMKKFGITEDYIIDKIGIDYEKLNEIIYSNDDDEKLCLWEKIVKVQVDEDLILKLKSFYKDYFPNESDLEEYIVQRVRNKNNIPRRMINSIQRLVSLADDIVKIRTEKDCPQVFFIVVCIETLYILAGERRKRKIDMVIDFFKNYVRHDDQKFILANIKRSNADKSFKSGEKPHASIDMEVFARLLYEIRSSFVHEGNYWTFSFGSKKLPNLNCISVKEREDVEKQERVYEVGITYQSFREICVKGLMSYMDKYFEGLCD